MRFLNNSGTNSSMSKPNPNDVSQGKRDGHNFEPSTAQKSIGESLRGLDPQANVIYPARISKETTSFGGGYRLRICHPLLKY